MISASLTRRPRLRRRCRRPPDLRLLRGAHGPHASTRASTSPGIPPRTRTGSARTSLDWSASSASPSCGIPGGNFVSGYNWEDGVGPRRPSGRPASTRPGASIETQRVRPQRVRPWARKAAPGGDAGRQPRHPRRGCRARSTCSSTATIRTGTYCSDLRREPRRQGAARHPDVVPGQRDGRSLADRAQDGGRSTARLAAETARAMRQFDPTHRARRVRQLPPLDADVRHLGGDGPRARLRRRRLHLGARLLRAAQGTTWRASSPRRSTWTASSDDVVSTADHVRGDGSPQRSASTSPSTSGTSGTSRRCTSGTCRRTGRWRRGSIEDTYTVADAVVVGSLLVTPAAATATASRRLPGPARQRDRLRSAPSRAARPGGRPSSIPSR